MTFLDFFAGIGGFRRGMELAGHKCVGFCEFDKFAVASYTSMHLITDAQREYLATLPMKQRQKEILKEEYRNGEWFADDIRRVDAGSLPSADCWCFGFPCQDISIAGKRKGLQGNRSGLFYRVVNLLGEIAEEKRPGWLFIENVKNLLGVNSGWDFARLLTELDAVGYDAEWQVLNSSDFGIPQNRERVFIIGHFRERSGQPVFPFGFIHEDDKRNEGRKLANTLKASHHIVGVYPSIEGGVHQSEQYPQGCNLSRKQGRWRLRPVEHACTIDAHTPGSPQSFQTKTVVLIYDKQNYTAGKHL